MAKKKVKSMIPDVSYDSGLEKMSFEEAGDFETKKKKAPVKQKVAPVKQKKEKKKSFWSRFKPISVKESNRRKAERKKEIKAKRTKESQAAYKSPITGVEKSAAKKKGITTSDEYRPVDKVHPELHTVTRKDTRVKTKGGDYPVYRKDTTSSKSFSKTFGAARKAGKKTFEWQGRKYTTKTKADGGEVKKMQQGGEVPTEKPFKQGIKYYKGGGSVTTSNDNAGAGDIAHVHSHSGYKAGE